MNLFRLNLKLVMYYVIKETKLFKELVLKGIWLSKIKTNWMIINGYSFDIATFQ